MFEASPRAGGIVSTRHEGSLVLEEGPDSFLTEKPEGLALVRRLGLEERLQGTRPEYRNSFVVRDGRLVPTPPGFYLLAPTKLASMLASPVQPGRQAAHGGRTVRPPPPRQSRRDVRREPVLVRDERLGREALERIAQPMVSGIYGADPEELSWPRRSRASSRSSASTAACCAGSPARARRRPAAPLRPVRLARGRDADLTDALLARVPHVRTSAPVRAIAPAGAGWTVDGEGFDAVVLALPAAAAARLARAFDPALAATLEAFEAGSSATVSLAYRADLLADPLEGAGFVVPRGESAALGGVIGGSFTHRKFEGRAPEGVALLRMFFADGDAAREPDALAERAHEAAVRLLGAREPAEARHVARWPGGMPRYRVGHAERVRAMRAGAARHRTLALAGNSYTGIGIPDCIRSGEEAARAVHEALSD